MEGTIVIPAFCVVLVHRTVPASRLPPKTPTTQRHSSLLRMGQSADGQAGVTLCRGAIRCASAGPYTFIWMDALTVKVQPDRPV